MTGARGKGRRGEEEEAGLGVSSDERRIRRQKSQLKTPQPVTSGYSGSRLSDGFEERESGSRGVGLVQQIRGVAENDGGQFSSSSSLGEGEPPRLAPVKPKGRSRRYMYSLVPYYAVRYLYTLPLLPGNQCHVHTLCISY